MNENGFKPYLLDIPFRIDEILIDLNEDIFSRYPDGRSREEYLLFVEEPFNFRLPLVPNL